MSALLIQGALFYERKEQSRYLLRLYIRRINQGEGKSEALFEKLKCKLEPHIGELTIDVIDKSPYIKHMRTKSIA